MCQPPFPKGGSAGEVMGDEDNDASGSSAVDADALYRAACDKSFSPPHCTPQSWGTDGSDFYLHLFFFFPLNAARNQNIFHRGDEIYLKGSRSNKATLGNTSISFSKLLFSHAGGKIIASQM